ncbi:hypothetical protein [Bifidobacterium sp.]|uniref:hypothetical protein n=1 Tax=Bifidobacterium sp. TaxID=41200 RepID=UPI0025C411FD|nr:hypothetical protein [Bifidobacterium sp.]MCI1634629.1 hypothetical protein [Bifidobacterium sp.]
MKGNTKPKVMLHNGCEVEELGSFELVGVHLADSAGGYSSACPCDSSAIIAADATSMMNNHDSRSLLIVTSEECKKAIVLHDETIYRSRALMRGNNNWNFAHYLPIPEYVDNRIYIHQIIPEDHGFRASWDAMKPNQSYQVMWRDIEHGSGGEIQTRKTYARVTGLSEGHDYEIRITSTDGTCTSHTRLCRCGDTPGTVVNYLHPQDRTCRFSGRFLASPSIVRLDSGKLLVSMDVFEWHGGQNLTILFESTDNGETWQYVTEIFPCFWGALFSHNGKLYMLAMATEYGDLLLGVSLDEGKTWSAPITLFRASAHCSVGGLHKAPTPVVEKNGVICTAIDYGSWETGGFRQAILSIAVTDDLMVASNWKLSELYSPCAALQQDAGIVGGGLEGNVLRSPDGSWYDMLRLQLGQHQKNPAKALLLRVDDDLQKLHYGGVVEFNGGNNTKFYVVFDAVSQLYWAVGNEIIGDDVNARTILSLSVSEDLRGFRSVHRIVDLSNGDAAFVAAQYPSFVIENDDLLVVSRTAINGADSFHNSNYITFHRVENFRSYASES